jgi:sec-independent protein translocase protein TatC
MVEHVTEKTESDEDDRRMTLGEHLEELRMRLFRSAIAVAVVFCACWSYRAPLTDYIFAPYAAAAERLNADLDQRAVEAITLAEAEDAPVEELGEEEWREWYGEAGYPELKVLRSDLRVPDRMKGDAASHGFIFIVKMCLFVSLFLAGPMILWQAWMFVAAGLYRKERGVVYRYFPFSTLLFLGGVLFGYFVMVPNALYFLARMTLTQIQYFESVGNYWSFFVTLTLALGGVFQLPVIMMALAKLDIVAPATFAKFRPHMLVGSLFFAAIITPPDPYTQMMMAVPIAILYEAGIWIGRVVAPKSVADSDQ